jgi:hypothetical protein
LEINLGNLNQAALYAAPIFLCLLKYLLSKKLLKYLLSNTIKANDAVLEVRESEEEAVVSIESHNVVPKASKRRDNVVFQTRRIS